MPWDTKNQYITITITHCFLFLTQYRALVTDISAFSILAKRFKEVRITGHLIHEALSGSGDTIFKAHCEIESCSQKSSNALLLSHCAN